MAAVINLDTVRLMRNIEDAPLHETQNAEIILFPGIRYERWEDEAPAGTTNEQVPVAGKRATSRD